MVSSNLHVNDYFVCVQVVIFQKISNEKIKSGGERVVSRINDFTRKSLISFSTLYSTLLYSTTLLLHTNNYLTTPSLASCKQTTTSYAGVVC